MSEVVKVVCTDQGQHGQMELGGLYRGSDGVVREVRTRQAPAPWGKGATLSDPDNEQRYPLDARAAVVAPDTRADFEGRVRFRYRCPACGRDKKLNQASAIRLYDGLVAAGRRVVDICLEMTQRDFARFVGQPPSAIAAIESGHSQAHIIEIARVLEAKHVVRATWTLGLNQPPASPNANDRRRPRVIPRSELPRPDSNREPAVSVVPLFGALEPVTVRLGRTAA